MDDPDRSSQATAASKDATPSKHPPDSSSSSSSSPSPSTAAISTAKASSRAFLVPTSTTSHSAPPITTSIPPPPPLTTDAPVQNADDDDDDDDPNDPNDASPKIRHPSDRRRRKKTRQEFRTQLALRASAQEPFGSTLKPDLQPLLKQQPPVATTASLPPVTVTVAASSAPGPTSSPYASSSSSASSHRRRMSPTRASAALSRRLFLPPSMWSDGSSRVRRTGGGKAAGSGSLGGIGTPLLYEDPFVVLERAKTHAVMAERWRRALEMVVLAAALALAGIAFFGARWIVFDFKDPRIGERLATETTGLVFSCVVEPGIQDYLPTPSGNRSERTCRATFFMHCGWHGSSVMVKACSEIRSATATASVGAAAQLAAFFTIIIEFFSTFYEEGPPSGARAVAVASSIIA
ncbi:hypothetical protein HDU96_011128, partial [Phlyctochytrium bullatum]